MSEKIDRAALRALCAKAGTDQMSDTFIDTHAARVELMEDAISTIPALLDALEEQEAMTSALNGDVTELGQKLEAAEAREKNLLAAVKNIAKQRLHAEIADCDPDELDWLSGYEGCVKEARAALAETAP